MLSLHETILLAIPFVCRGDHGVGVFVAPRAGGMRFGTWYIVSGLHSLQTNTCLHGSTAAAGRPIWCCWMARLFLCACRCMLCRHFTSWFLVCMPAACCASSLFLCACRLHMVSVHQLYTQVTMLNATPLLLSLTSGYVDRAVHAC